MKRIASILLLFLLFFNWIGYRLVSDFLQIQSDSRLEARLDRNEYDESQLITIRIPINLPYYSYSQGSERFNGEIDIDGIHYKYVKRKIENGELVLLCIPNHDKEKIQGARVSYFEKVNDLGQNTQGKNSDSGNSTVFKFFLSDYKPANNEWSLTRIPEKNSYNSIRTFAIPHSRYALLPEQPPEC